MPGGSPLFASLGRRLSSVPVVSSSIRDLLDQIREDWLYNGEEWTRPGFRALAMYRFGVWRMTIKSWLLRAPLSALYRFLHRWVRNHYGIELPYTAKVGRRVVIAHQGAIVIHEFAEIGNDCVIRQGVTIGAAGQYLDGEAPKLGRGVTLGAGAVLVGNVTIGDGARIGPNAVVMTDVPAGGLAVSPPARVIQPGGFSETNEHAESLDREAKSKAAALTDQVQSLQQQVTEIQSTVAETNERAESLDREAESKVAALTDQVRELEATLIEQSASLEEFRQESLAAEEENRRLSETLDEQEAQLKEGAKAKATVQDQLGAAENRIIDLGVELDHRAQQVDAKDQQCRETEVQIQSLQQQVTEIQSTVAETNEAKARTNDLEELSFGQKIEAKYAAARANGASAQRNDASGQPSETAVGSTSESEAQTSDPTTLSFGQKVEASDADRAS